MRKAGVFRRIGDVPPMDWFGMGCFAKGYLPWLLDHGQFEGQEFDLVAVGGNLRRYAGANGRIFEFYRGHGVPVFVIETGRLYFYKLGRHWFLYLNQVPVIPPADAVEPSRWRQMFPPIEFKPRGDAILVIGQTREFDKDVERNVVANIRRFTDRKIIWRPRRGHSNPKCCSSFDHVEISTEMVPEADLDKAWAVVCHSSNMGGEALMRGIPVFCDPIATYAEYASQTMNTIDHAARPQREAVEEYLARLSYITVSDAELREGRMTKWLLENMPSSRVPEQESEPSTSAEGGSTDRSQNLTSGSSSMTASR